MLYPFMTLNNNTEIVHSESIEKNGKEQAVGLPEVIIEQRDEIISPFELLC